MKIKKVNVIQLFKDTIKAWSDDKVTNIAAALSYYTVFSLAPLLLLFISLIGFIYGETSAREQLTTQLNASLGKEGTIFITSLLKPHKESNVGMIASIIGIASLFLGALGIFGHIKTSLNDIWHIKVEKQGIMKIITTNIASFIVLFFIGILFIISTLLSTLVTSLSGYIANIILVPSIVIQITNGVVSFILLSFVFAMIYKLLTDAKITWSDIMVGSLFTAFLFTLGRLAIAFYLGNFAALSQYGAAGSLILILLWVYYSSQIFFLGAEFTKVYAYTCGSLCESKPPVSSKEKEIAKSFISGFAKGIEKNLTKK